ERGASCGVSEWASALYAAGRQSLFGGRPVFSGRFFFAQRSTSERRHIRPRSSSTGAGKSSRATQRATVARGLPRRSATSLRRRRSPGDIRRTVSAGADKPESEGITLSEKGDKVSLTFP